jgi:GTPase SAR1 family protein
VCPDAVVTLVGNKVDLDKRVVTRKEGKALAKGIDSYFYETSAKSGENIETMFTESVKRVFELDY